MVDRESRTRLALGLRRLAAGRLTNDQFHCDYLHHALRSRDAGVRAIGDAAWTLYDDFHEHRLADAFALDGRGKREVARWILFLASGREYRWPRLLWWWGLLLLVPNLLTLGLLGWLIRRRHDRHGELAVWPFLEAGELQSARRVQPGNASLASWRRT